jgi:hypothetical protein
MRTARTFWTLIVVGLMALCVPLMSARPSVSSTSATPEQVQALLQGSWLLTITPEPGPVTIPPFRGLMTYTADGGVVETDTAPIAAVVPGYSATAGHGAWAARGDEFVSTVVKLAVDGNGQFAGFVRIQGTVKLNPARDGYGGSGKVEVLNSSGAVVASGNATIQATGIRA